MQKVLERSDNIVIPTAILDVIALAIVTYFRIKRRKKQI